MIRKERELQHCKGWSTYREPLKACAGSILQGSHARRIPKMMICIGGVCIPLNLLLPFLVGLLHRYGWLQGFKQEYVTLRYWQKR